TCSGSSAVGNGVFVTAAGSSGNIAQFSTTTGTSAAIYGSCATPSGFSGFKACQCYGTTRSSVNYGPYGGAFCEVLACHLPPAHDATVLDPSITVYPALTAAGSVTLTLTNTFLAASTTTFPTYSIPYRGTGSPNYFADTSNPTLIINSAWPNSITYTCVTG